MQSDAGFEINLSAAPESCIIPTVAIFLLKTRSIEGRESMTSPGGAKNPSHRLFLATGASHLRQRRLTALASLTHPPSLACRRPVKGIEPKAPALTWPFRSSPSSVAWHSSIIGIGTETLVFQLN
ncbi:hypothetical protein [Sphingopyxis sp. SCN 67-31]|uniref:hypothetical protein n=1 Tax=Sphingopyxis sp. SCN 67-31 TaxID=1660142 RepID=UPI0033903162